MGLRINEIKTNIWLLITKKFRDAAAYILIELEVENFCKFEYMLYC